MVATFALTRHVYANMLALKAFRRQNAYVYRAQGSGIEPEAGRRVGMTVTIGINGFGRIGRCTLAHITEAARNDVQVVKINATGPIETSAHLL